LRDELRTCGRRAAHIPPHLAFNKHLLSKCCLGLLPLHTALVVGCVVYCTAAALNVVALR
jgi:hypothetical protein